jgi:hypothetical protein
MTATETIHFPDAFILGAGFSKAISASMPLTQELGQQCIDQLKHVHESRGKPDGSPIRPDEHSDHCDGISCDGTTPLPTFQSGALNFEEWLSTLAEPQPFHLQPENARRQALFSELTGSVALNIDQAEARAVEGHTPPEWLARLVTGWHAKPSNVVTFNYDTLVEATVDRLGLREPGTNRIFSHAEVGPALIPAVNQWTHWSPMRVPAVESFSYMKLHGSTHWYWDEITKAADSIVQVGVRHEWGPLQPAFTDDNRRFRAPGKVPMIVPPVTVKDQYFGNPIIRNLWHDAYWGLGMARRIFVFGYSLPAGDTLVRSMLAEVLSNKDVWIVNPDADVADRFDALKPGKLHRDFAGERCSPEEFVADWLSLNDVAI